MFISFNVNVRNNLICYGVFFILFSYAFCLLKSKLEDHKYYVAAKYDNTYSIIINGLNSLQNRSRYIITALQIFQFDLNPTKEALFKDANGLRMQSLCLK